MKKVLNIFIICAIASSVAFGQFSKGTKAIDGEFAILKPSEGDALTMLSLQYGQFFTDDILVGLQLSYAGSDGESATDFGLFGDYFFNDSMYVGAGMLFPEVGDSEAFVGFGMLSPFRESKNVYLNPGLQYYTDSEIIAAGVSLVLLF
tara:strand:- start:231 stop:674 length:444 start_codon:yes stop_codon:yes gene_type:complete